jgi:hypothetical protein
VVRLGVLDVALVRPPPPCARAGPRPRWRRSRPDARSPTRSRARCGCAPR